MRYITEGDIIDNETELSGGMVNWPARLRMGWTGIDGWVVDER